MCIQHSYKFSIFQLLKEVEQLNNRADIHGIIVQLPLETTNEINTDLVLNTIAPEKDVDGYLINAIKY